MNYFFAVLIDVGMFDVLTYMCIDSASVLDVHVVLDREKQVSRGSREASVGSSDLPNQRGLAYICVQSDLAYTPHLHIATYLGQKTRCFIHIDYGYLIRMKQPIVNLSIPLPDSYLQTMISPNTRATRVNMFAEFLHMLSPKTRSTPRNII